MQNSNNKNIVNAFVFNGQPMALKSMKRILWVDSSGILDSSSIGVNPYIVLRRKNRAIGTCTGTEIKNSLSVKLKPALQMIVDIFFCQPLRADKPMV